MKRCSKCGARKAESRFYTNARCKDGLRSECKECSLKMTQKYRVKHKRQDLENLDENIIRAFQDVIESLNNLNRELSRLKSDKLAGLAGDSKKNDEN